MRGRVVLAALLLAQAGAANAIFGDDEARRQIAELRKQVDAQQQRLAKIEAEAGDRKALLDLSGQIESLRQEISRLRGQIEVLTYQSEQLDRKQKDLYTDLDTRLRRLEEGQAQAQAQPSAAEQLAYDNALGQFKAGNYGSAIQGFQSFVSQHPTSKLTPSAQYWIGNAYYALRDYKSAIAAQQKVLSSWPDDPKAPDAMLNIATSQAEMGDITSSRRTLSTLLQKYPASPAAQQAKQRLGSAPAPAQPSAPAAKR